MNEQRKYLHVDIERVLIDSLVPYPDNPRRGDVETIADSIQVNGIYKPLIVQTSTYTILAGNHTWQAAKKLGHKEIDVVWADVDDETAKRIMLVDNRSSELAYNDSTYLLEILTSLNDLEGTGYLQKDIDALIKNTDISDYPIIQDSTHEINTDKWEFEHTCPKCQFEFND